MIALALSLHVKDVVDNLEVKEVAHGFSKKMLEAKALVLEKAKNWKAFNIVLALLIYAIILFPNTDDLINLPIINIFLAKNLIPNLVVDVYYYLHVKHDKKKSWSCVVPLLYTWLMSHMPTKGPFMAEDLKWPQKLESLYSNVVVWYK